MNSTFFVTIISQVFVQSNCFFMLFGICSCNGSVVFNHVIVRIWFQLVVHHFQSWNAKISFENADGFIVVFLFEKVCTIGNQILLSCVVLFDFSFDVFLKFWFYLAFGVR